MNTLFLGLAMSLIYGLVSAALLFFLAGKSDSQHFFEAYTSTFRTLISLGLIAGTALVVFRSQNAIPHTIEAAFSTEELGKTDYSFYRQRFASRRRSINFAAQFIVVAFIIFSYCQFPLSRKADAFMMIAVCAEYALGVYAGRKLCYAGMMLHSLLSATVSRNLFEKRELDDINTYVNIASTLTIIFVYVHVMNYYEGPFAYKSMFGQSIKPLLALPAIIATPVLLIFNFYPRAVLRKLYSESIDVAVKELQERLQTEGASESEKHSYIIQFNKMHRDELRYSLQLSLNDLPIGITILIMLLQPILKK